MPNDATGTHEITRLLRAWEQGQATALDRLVPLVYGELKRLARRHMRGGECGTLQTTAVVHEAYIRLVDISSVSWQDRAHFYAVAARIMRFILVDAARVRRSQKHGGLLRRDGTATEIDLDQIPDMGSGRAEEILAVHEALERLAEMDSRQAQVVEDAFFRRAQRGGDRRGAEGLAAERLAGLEAGQSLAAEGNWTGQALKP